ncbi:MAG: hypothetical protein K6B72_13945 [Lachnospiraceae bacterium]|nr:hypothetical protein [Lachnospiraceae bacterium]
MKTWIKKLIALLVFLAITGICLNSAYRILSWKDTMGSYLSSVEQLYATPEDRIDALFVGSSHCYAAVNPDVMWRDYGIAAFDMAISGQGKSSALHYTIEALKTQSPGVVVLDLLATTFEQGIEGNRYRNLLSMRTSRNQYEMVMEAPYENKADYLLKWPIVHTRYRELGAYDFIDNPYNSYGRGYCYRFTVNEVIHQPGLEDLTEEVPISDSNRKWIDDFIALSEQENFVLLPVILPHEMTVGEKQIYNGVLEYLGERGIDYIDFNKMIAELQLSYLTDFMDQGHLNYYGAEKLSGYLGGYLREKWNLPDHRGEPGYEEWEESLVYAEHLITREELFQSANSADYLAGASQLDDLTIIVRRSAEDADDEIRVLRGADVLWDSASADPGKEYVTDLDYLHVLSLTLKDERYSAEINGEPVFEDERGTSVCVFDHRLGEIWEARYFAE